MSVSVSRARFLRGDFRNSAQIIRPPWAKDEENFTDLCTRCGDCIRLCPEQIIQKGSAGFPEVSFLQGECTFCAACVESCPTKALDLNVFPILSAKAVVEKKCLNYQAVVCMTCKEQCPEQAIKFQVVAMGISVPQVNLQLCNGCGACVASCPTQAIQITKQDVVEEV